MDVAKLKLTKNIKQRQNGILSFFVYINNQCLKKGTQTGSFFALYAIKQGTSVLLHQKKVYMRKGGMKYEQIQFIRCTLNSVEKSSIFFPFRILMLSTNQKLRFLTLEIFSRDRKKGN